MCVCGWGGAVLYACIEACRTVRCYVWVASGAVAWPERPHEIHIECGVSLGGLWYMCVGGRDICGNACLGELTLYVCRM